MNAPAAMASPVRHTRFAMWKALKKLNKEMD